jgi:glycosyltransferase involved in cell wall biosynthesis
VKVSVIIPNYNHARFLPARIESVLEQTLSGGDVHILDDASTDDSRAVIARYLGGRVRFTPGATNSGSTFAQWNKGFAAATGEYVWIAESDDVAEPRFLERMVGLLEAHPRVAFAYCQAALIDGDGRPFGLALPSAESDGSPSPYAADFVRAGVEELRVCVRYQMSPVPNASSVVFRRSALVAAGPADPSYRICGDLHLYCRLLQRGDVGYVAEPLNRYRHHAGTVRVRAERDGTGLVERYRLFREFRVAAQLPGAMEEEALRRLAERWVTSACRRVGRLPWPIHRRVWTLAREVDPRLLRHLAGAAGRHLRGSLRRRASFPA